MPGSQHLIQPHVGRLWGLRGSEGVRGSASSKGGTKVGRMKDPLYKDSYLGITPPTFILPFEAPDSWEPLRLSRGMAPLLGFGV